ncbi:MAG TPA: hypothetical protein ENK18_06215 [Deltaproteobacteria bacterium]|nr:hypothetical protein [Deltaproteobacteria bacterium]
MISALLLWMIRTSPAWVGATVTVQGDTISDQTARSVVWHALVELGGRAPLLLDGPPEASVIELRRNHLSTLLSIEISWVRSALWRDGRMIWTEAPRIALTEHAVGPAGLRTLEHYQFLGEPELAHTAEGWLPVPAYALEASLERVLDELAIPAWGLAVGPSTAAGRTLRVPVIISTDAPYRERHGPCWRDAVAARLQRASALLQAAGIELVVERYEDWAPDTGTSSPVALLADLSTSHARQGPDGELDRAVRVGLSGVRRTRPTKTVEAVGAAYVPGRHLVVVDPPATGARDVTQDGTAIAHELLHALGVPHPDEPGVVGSATLAGPVHELAPASQALARAAAEARWAHWDPTVAAVLLADAATHLPERELRMTYVTRNLAAGQGDGDEHTRRWAALAREALEPTP